MNLKIKIEDLAENQKDIALLIGIENYVKLSKIYGGDAGLYIQKYSEISKNARNREIRNRYNGYNTAYLAKIYNLSERHVKRICYEGPDSE